MHFLLGIAHYNVQQMNPIQDVVRQATARTKYYAGQNMEKMSNNGVDLPRSDDFRVWVQQSIDALSEEGKRKMAISNVSVGAGLTANALGMFMRKDNFSIGLDAAARVQKYLKDLAQQQSVDLPALGGSASE